MNKTELLAQLESRLGSRQAAAAALDSVLTEIQDAVAAGSRVTLTGFGTFERVERPARTGRNPRTGATIEIAASAAPRFHPGAGLRAAVAGSTPGARAVSASASSGTTVRVASPARAARAPRIEPGKPVKTAKVGAGGSKAKNVAPEKAAKSSTAVKSTKSAKSAKDSKPAKSAKQAKASKKSSSGKGAKSSGGKKKK